ncbi:MAG TPA: hypothetical protein VE547_07865 [Mycobacteriales bacterium]|nr:hypothetical protein [Mycobacteriales bacterium]
MSTRRPRLLPTALAASALVVATATGVLTATGTPGPVSVEACAPGQEWVTVRPVFDRSDWQPAKEPANGPTLAGCLDTSRPAPADGPTNPRG